MRRPLPYTWRDWALAALVPSGLVFDVAFRDLVWRPVAAAFGGGLALAVLVRRTYPLAAVMFAFGGFDVATFVAGTEPVVLDSGWVVFNGQPGIEVVGQAADGRTAGALARRLRPDAPVRHPDARPGRHRGHPSARRPGSPWNDGR